MRRAKKDFVAWIHTWHTLGELLIPSIGVVVGTLDVPRVSVKNSKADQLAAANRMTSRGR
jgi:hypothetical protein